jgi:hypothetical protein
MLMLFEPELETNKLLPSGVAQVALPAPAPAQREKARPAGFVPTCTQ